MIIRITNVSNHRNLSIAAAVVAFGLPLTASAQQTAYTAAPVNVGACEVSSIDEHVGGTGYFTLDLPQRNLHLSFTNTGKVPATKVSFLVNDGTSHQIDDRGTFSPGATIDREIRDTTASEGSAQCTVADVQFADGSSWHATNVNLAKASR
jgi:hypothetical protein